MVRGYKPIITIKKTEEIKYRILNGLSKNREYHINSMDQQKRRLLIQIGQSVKPLDPEHPVIWHTPRTRHDERRYLKLSPDIELIEKTEGKDIKFKFRKRRII